MLFIKLTKVQNMTCSKFKHYMTILCCLIKYKKKESEHFMQTIETKINESERFTQTRIAIHIFELLSESYIQKKTCRRQCYTDLNRKKFYNSCRQVNFKKIKRINVNTVEIYMNNNKTRSFINRIEQICLMKSYLLRRVFIFLLPQSLCFLVSFLALKQFVDMKYNKSLRL